MKKILEDKLQITWLSLFLFSLFGVIFMLCVSMTHNPIVSSDRFQTPWEEKLITPFYFTFISNIFAVVVPLVVLLGFLDKNNHQIRLKLLMVVSLTITGIVYWTLLGRKSVPHQSAIMLTNNIILHALTPIFATSVFIYDCKQTSKKKDIGMKDILIIMIFPIVWLFFALSFYYGMGAQKKDAIYSFLAFEQNAWYWSVLYIDAIAVSYFAFSFIYLKIYKSLKPA